jgi:hypothetical protein
LLRRLGETERAAPTVPFVPVDPS